MTYAESWVRTILPMENLGSTQKIILMDVLLNEKEGETFNAMKCYDRLNIERHAYNKQLRILRQKGLVKKLGKSTYKLNIDIF